MLRAVAIWTVPTGFIGEPPPGPATPVMATAMWARLLFNAPSAIIRATGSDTAPKSAIRSPGMPSISSLARLV